MSVGFVLLVHDAFDRVEQVARYWAAAGCPIVIHVDGKVRPRVFRAFRARFDGDPRIRFCGRVPVEWGTWSLVRATQMAAERLLRDFGEVSHVFLASGSCLPLRPLAELQAHLDAHPETDFIESVTTDHVAWTVDGLELERFTLRFPFSWRRHRRLFDRYVSIQRRLGIRRRIPDGVLPHLGSQWWCLTRRTLESILAAPDRAAIDAYFSKVWIPDESYFQSLARRYAVRIESRSLTLSRFDIHGRPHMFYDDHLPLLERSDCFVGRKVWPGADGLYRALLDPARETGERVEPNPGKLDRVVSKANERRRQGRPGLYSQARFPAWGHENGVTCARYNVVWGMSDLVEGFEPWLGRQVGGRMHGHLYHPDGAEFADGETVMRGCLSNAAGLRDYRPTQFLTNLLWATRGERQTFLFGPGDRQEVGWFLTRDPNATLAIVSGAWAVPLARSEEDFDAVMAAAARLQREELAFLGHLRSPGVAARVHLWTLAEFVAGPSGKLRHLLDEIARPGTSRPAGSPPMRDLSALPDFLSRLRNGGIKPQVMGDLDLLDRARRKDAPRHDAL